MTLLEVLLSLAIFALAAVGFGAAYVNTLGALRAMAEGERESSDWRLVRSIVLSEPDQAKAERGGELQLTGEHRVLWVAEIRATPVIDLFEVSVKGRVVAPGGAEHVHEESFRVLRPTWSDPVAREKMLETARALRPKGKSA